MTIGCSTPRFEKFAQLYPRSSHLKISLFEYFVVVVHLCHQILLFTKNSTLKRLVVSLCTSDLAEYQSKLEFYAISIRDEVAYLIAQRIEGQAESESQSKESRESSSLLLSVEDPADHNGAQQAMETVRDYFSKHPDGLAAQEYFIMGKLMERIRLAKSSKVGARGPWGTV